MCIKLYYGQQQEVESGTLPENISHVNIENEEGFNFLVMEKAATV